MTAYPGITLINRKKCDDLFFNDDVITISISNLVNTIQMQVVGEISKFLVDSFLIHLF